MELKDAVSALSALAHEHRLEVFRMLVKAGIGGRPAGEIAEHLGIPRNTLSTHLAALTQAKLLSSQRNGRHIIYRASFAGAQTLLAFLLEDCCQGDPQACRPALDSLPSDCC